MLELDYTNVLEDAVGRAHGINKSALDGAAGSSAKHIETLENARKAGTLGFMDLPFDEAPVKAVTQFARERALGNVLVLGIGGSALGPMAIDSALAKPNTNRRLVVLDNIDPDFIADTLETLEPQDTLVNIIAKSGVTAETMATFAIVRKWMAGKLGEERARKHFVATTDPDQGDLLAVARQENYPVFLIPPNVGGRFSVLSPVGTLPAALLGFNVESMMEGARRAALQARKPFMENPALVSAFIEFMLDRERRKSILVLFPYSQALWKFAFWFKQLWGESLGKRMDRQGREVYCGQTPTAALGVTDQHSQLQLFIEGPNDKSFIFWEVKQSRKDPPIEHPYSKFDSMAYLENQTLGKLFRVEKQATEIALTEASRPNATVTVDRISEDTIGELFMFSQYMTAYAGEYYDINAFDQPGVEYGKKLTFAMMNRPGFSEYAGTVEKIRRKGRLIIR